MQKTLVGINKMFSKRFPFAEIPITVPLLAFVFSQCFMQVGNLKMEPHRMNRYKIFQTKWTVWHFERSTYKYNV